MDKIDAHLKEFIAARRALGARRPQAPTDEDYCLFLEGGMEGEALERMLEHLKDDPDARKLVSEARSLLEGAAEGSLEPVPEKVLAHARALGGARKPLVCPHCSKSITAFKAPPRRQGLLTALWFALAAASFAVSFFLPRYFMQYLVLMALFGFKGILDARTLKTQILIYKALAEEAPAHGHLQNSRSHL